MRDEKGFTMAELLTVMAVLAVLMAAAVPTFGKQLEIGREITDVGLLQAVYSDAQNTALSVAFAGKFDETPDAGSAPPKITVSDTDAATVVITDAATDTPKITVTRKNLRFLQAVPGFQYAASAAAESELSKLDIDNHTTYISFHFQYDKDKKILTLLPFSSGDYN